MAVDIDTLKTLQSIEKLLQGASVLAGERKLNSADRNKQTASQKAGKDAKRIYQATTDRAKELGNTVMGLSKSLFGLNTEVGNVTTGFGSLHSQMGKFMTSLTPITMPAETAAVGTQSIDTWLNKLVTEVAGSRADALKYSHTQAEIGHSTNRWLSLIAAGTSLGAAAEVGSMTSVQQGADLVGQIGKGITRGTKPVVDDIDKLNIPFKQQLGRLIDNFGSTTSALGGLGIAASNVKDILKKLTGDYFSLAAAGMGTMSNLMQLSKQAFMSGMSLKEYQAVIKENITVASRSGSLENFNKIISAADSQLASMGIFGQESRQMQASLAESSTLMGIKQSKLTDAIAAQISVFDDLRKSTNMTAEEFSGLMKSVSQNDQVQREMLGLGPMERMARQRELLSVASIGSKMGLAADASQKLATAMLEARGETVKGRIETMGRVRQLGQLTGMGAEGDRAGQLILKGRNRTDADEKELAVLADKLNKAGESAYQNGSLGVQNALDFFNETLGGTKFGSVMKAMRPAGLAQDSGQVNQEAFGKHVGEFGKFTGELLKYMRGWNESFGPMIAGLVGGLSLALFRGPIIKALAAGAGKLGIGSAVGEAAVSAAKAAPALTAAAKNSTVLYNAMYSVGKAAGTATRGLIELPTTLKNVFSMQTLSGSLQSVRGMGTLFSEGFGATWASIKSGGSMLLNGLKVFGQAFVITSALVDGIIEMVTGEIATALNPSGGFFNRIGGVITAAFSAIPNLFIDLLGFVFGEEMFVGQLRNSFDTIVAFMNMAVKDFLARMLGGIGGLLKKILPDDSKLVKFLESSSESLQNSAMENAVAVEKLTNDNTLTLKKMSAANETAAKKTQESTVKATTAQSAFNNVQSGLTLTQAGLMSDARAVIATPQVQVPNPVKPAAVNTPDEQATQNAAKQAQATQTQGNSELLNALNAMLAVMRDSLVSEQKQVELAEMLLRSNRPQASFPSSETTANLLLKGQPS